jgi:hypothetical protein
VPSAPGAGSCRARPWRHRPPFAPRAPTGERHPGIGGHDDLARPAQGVFFAARGIVAQGDVVATDSAEEVGVALHGVEHHRFTSRHDGAAEHVGAGDPAIVGAQVAAGVAGDGLGQLGGAAGQEEEARSEGGARSDAARGNV